jgi:hypothetical protein
MKNLTLHEMAITAIGIKRFELRNGKAPSELGALVPEFLATKPVDFMDGQPLRYRLNTNGTFTLYSVGDNLRDDGGSSALESSEKTTQNSGPWSGKDWVWPVAQTSGKGVQVSEAGFQ